MRGFGFNGEAVFFCHLTILGLFFLRCLRALVYMIPD